MRADCKETRAIARKCAWCSKMYPLRDLIMTPGDAESHGICDPCFEAQSKLADQAEGLE